MKRIQEKRIKRLRRKRHIRKKVRGSADRPRLSVFKSNRHLYAQVIDDSSGATLVSVSNLEAECRELRKNVEDAGKLGELLGKRMLDKQIKTAVFDRNGYPYRGIVKAIADGAKKAGIQL